MKKYQIDEKLINEIIDLMDCYRNDLANSKLDAVYIDQKRCKARELRRELRALKRVKYLIFNLGIRK